MAFKADYDVFLSHNSKDKPVVEELADKLTEAGLQVFLDKWCLVPGEPWQDELEEALLRSASCAVCIGQDSVGPWAHEEMRAALSQAVDKRSIRVIPVLLLGASTEVLKTLPLFLRNRTWVDLRNGAGDQEGIKRLVSGIFGRRPREFSPRTTPPVSNEETLEPRISQALSQASDYQDRKELNAMREFWLDDKSSGVFALVGIGGSGKTALVSRFLQELPSSGVSHDAVAKRPELPTASALFVWSFYDFPDVDQFVSNLMSYLQPNEDLKGNTADKALRLVQVLETRPYARILIVLDGLEVVQEGKEAEHLFGLLRDSSLRHLLRRLCQGISGVKTIITTRFPIPDLLVYKAAGYIQWDTDELEFAAACQLLQSRGVHGSRKDIEGLVHQFGSHALTLDHLGIVLRDFFGGDVKKASSLTPLEGMSSDAGSDYQAYRLSKLFRFYEQRLPQGELQLLKSLCIFRLPVEMGVLANVFTERENQADTEAQTAMTLTTKAILSLNTRRLVTIRNEGPKRWCNVHPSIREYFYASLGKEANKLHAQAVKAFVSLTERPWEMRERLRERSDPAEIDQIGELIYHTLRSEQWREAMDYYLTVLNGYVHLGWALAAFDKGYRITGYFNDYAWSNWRGEAKFVLNDRALFMLDIGRTVDAQVLLQKLIEIQDGPRDDPHLNRAYQSVLECNLCDALIAAGKLPDAESLADGLCKILDVGVIEASHELRSEWYFYFSHRSLSHGFNPFARRAGARAQRGNIDGAVADYEAAALFKGGQRRWREEAKAMPLVGQSGVDYAMLLARIGETKKAQAVLHRCQSQCLSDSRPTRKAAWLLGRAEILRLHGRVKQSAQFVEQSLAWAIETGHQELYCRSQLLIGKLYLTQENVTKAAEAIAEACRTADDCSFGIHALDGGVLSAWVSYSQGDRDQAQAKANEVADRASDRSCDYRWGIADAFYLEGKCLLADGKRDEAIQKLELAAESRRQLRDPRFYQVERLLAEAKR